MSMCEKCWSEAFTIAFGTSKSQTEVYLELLEKRKDHPCSPREQAGQWWDEERQYYSRLIL